MVDLSKLKRNPDKVKKDLKELDNGQVVTTKGCKIYIPLRYEEQSLAEIGTQITTLAFFAIVNDSNDYAVSKALTKIKTKPDEIGQVKIEDDVYMELTYLPGSVIIENIEVAMDSNLLYGVWNEFISKGKLPWFIDYRDLSEIFKESSHYTGVKLGANHVIWEMIAADISRNPKNLHQQYRYIIKDKKDLETNPPAVVKLNSVTYGATNTTTKLLGSYFDEGLASALVNPSTKTEDIETLLRQ